MDKRRELSKKTFLWLCPEETEPIWESIYVFTKGQVRVRGQEAAHSSESTVSTENLQVFLDEVPILPPQAVLNDDGEQSTQGPLPGCCFPQWNETKAELLPSNVLSSAPTCFYHSLGPWTKSDFLCVCFLAKFTIFSKAGTMLYRVCISYCPGKACHVYMARHHWLLSSSLSYVSGNKLPDFRV